MSLPKACVMHFDCGSRERFSLTLLILEGRLKCNKIIASVQISLISQEIRVRRALDTVSSSVLGTGLRCSLTHQHQQKDVVCARLS